MLPLHVHTHASQALCCACMSGSTLPQLCFCCFFIESLNFGENGRVACCRSASTTYHTLNTAKLPSAVHHCLVSGSRDKDWLLCSWKRERSPQLRSKKSAVQSNISQSVQFGKQSRNKSMDYKSTFVSKGKPVFVAIDYEKCL